MFRIVATCLLALAGTASAQTPRSSLTGTVSDTNGALLDEAPIQVKNKLTGKLARARSDNGGRYTIPDLPAGAYEVSVAMPCCAYSRFSKDLTLEYDLTSSSPRL